jgi:hypothetical protein
MATSQEEHRMSSWDDVIIGKPEPGYNQYTSASKFPIKGAPDGGNGWKGMGHSISRGRDHFRLNDMILDLGATIYRGCPEFDTLEKMIAKDDQLATILNYLDKVILNHLSPAKLRFFIQRAEATAFDNGKAAAKQELRTWLRVS